MDFGSYKHSVISMRTTDYFISNFKERKTSHGLVNTLRKIFLAGTNFGGSSNPPNRSLLSGINFGG